MKFAFAPGSRRRRLAMIAAGLWFFACLLYSAPAQLFALLAQSGGVLQLGHVEGSFWQGRADEAYIVLPDQRTVALGALQWRLQPLSLLWLHPRAHIAARYGEQFLDADVRIAPTGTVLLRNVRAGVPLAAFNDWLLLPAQGDLAIDLAELELSRSELRRVQGHLSWLGASWQWNMNWLTLGDYQCRLRMSAAAQLQCALQGGSALGLKGEVLVDLKQRQYALQAQVNATDSLPQDFRVGLSLLLGGRDSHGPWPLSRKGHW